MPYSVEAETTQEEQKSGWLANKVWVNYSAQGYIGKEFIAKGPVLIIENPTNRVCFSLSQIHMLKELLERINP